MQHEVTKLVRESAANIAAKCSEGLYKIQREDFTEGNYAAEAKHVQMLNEQEAKYLQLLTKQGQRFDKTMREQDGWVLGYSAAWTEAQLQAEQEAAFVDTFIN